MRCFDLNEVLISQKKSLTNMPLLNVKEPQGDSQGATASTVDVFLKWFPKFQIKFYTDMLLSQICHYQFHPTHINKEVLKKNTCEHLQQFCLSHWLTKEVPIVRISLH